MVFLDDLKEMTLYKKPFILPVDEENIRKGSAIFLVSPNAETSKAMMNYPYLINKMNTFNSYYLEKNANYYINQEGNLIPIDRDDEYIHEVSEDELEEASKDGITLNSYKCMECGTTSKNIEIKPNVKPNIRRISRLHPNWDLSNGTLYYAVCPKCGNRNDIIINNECCRETTSITEAHDFEKYNPNFKKRTGGNFDFIDIHDAKAQEYLASDKYYNKQIKKYISIINGEIVVDKDTGKVAGAIYVGGGSKKSNRNYGFIQTLEVYKPYRGYGLSNKLLDDAIKKYNAVDLTVYRDNDVASELYKKHGFVIIGAGNTKNSDYWMKLKSKLTEEDKKRIEAFTEACKSVKDARKFVSDVSRLAKKYDANYFIITDGASGIHNNGNPAVKHARDCQVEWEKENGFDPNEDWSKVNEATLSSKERNELSDSDFGLPDKRKYPLTDAQHVKSAIRFFNYVDAEDEAELAKNIKKKAKEFKVPIRCGDGNRLSKYITEEYVQEFMAVASIGNDMAAVCNGTIRQHLSQGDMVYSFDHQRPYTKKTKKKKEEPVKEEINIFQPGDFNEYKKYYEEREEERLKEWDEPSDVFFDDMIKDIEDICSEELESFPTDVLNEKKGSH